MQIEEVTEETLQAEAAKQQEQQGFVFTQINLGDPKVFPNFKAKETGEHFYKWGITDKNQILGKFRFNKTFHLIGAEEFLKDLLNSSDVIKAYEPLRGLQQGKEIKFTKMNCNVLNMSYFDKLEELNLVTNSGAIRGNYEQRLDGIVLSDKLR